MRIRLLAFLLLFVVQFVAEGQTALPLIINIDGQVYHWLVGASEPIFTGCDLQGNVLRQWRYSLVLSSDGQWTAFMVLPSNLQEGAPSPTGNLWLCHVESGRAYALSNQSPEQSGAVSDGVFSPDGQHIIWTELVDYESSSVSMFIHDLASKQTSILVEGLGLDEHCGAGADAPSVIWGKYGIALAYSVLDDIACDGYEDYGFSYYDVDGKLINSFLVSRQSPGNYRWLDSGEPQIVFLKNAEDMPEAKVFSINMLTGDIREEVDILTAFPPNSGSSAVTFSPSGYSNKTEQIKLTGTDTVLKTATDVAFSADGESMIIVLGRALYFSENGNIVQAPWNMKFFPITTTNGKLELPPLNIGQFELAWAESVYRLAPHLRADCPSVSHLNNSEVVYVVDGLGENNVREAPFGNAKLLGTLPEGSAVSVIPEVEFYRPQIEVCSDGIRWREIFLKDIWLGQLNLGQIHIIFDLRVTRLFYGQSVTSWDGLSLCLRIFPRLSANSPNTRRLSARTT